MKKIIIILFLFLIFYSSYLIYTITDNKNKEYLLIGDSLLENININNSNKTYINKDYRVIDILNILKYNEEQNNISLHRLIKKSDIIIISIGMNDIYSKINDNLENIYTNLNQIIFNYEVVLNYINRYEKKEVFVLGYYNITNKNNDLFTYINYKLNKLTKKYNYTYIDLNKEINEYNLKNIDNYYLNNSGYLKINQIILSIIFENVPK